MLGRVDAQGIANARTPVALSAHLEGLEPLLNFTYIYIYICACVYMYIYIYIHAYLKQIKEYVHTHI